MPSITFTDVQKYLAKNSDFAFEMKCRKTLGKFGDAVSYSGSYVDPVTEKQRQYDFQVRIELPEFVVVACIEAKNVKPEKPIIVHRTARLERESFYDVVACEGGGNGTTYYGPTIKRVQAGTDLLRKGDFVGRSFDQYEGQSKDDQLYDKFSQPTNCLGSIVRSDRLLFKKRQKMIALVPILVVPNETLWTIDYDDHGTAQGDPKQSPMTAYFLGSTWDCTERLKFTVGHLFMVTEAGLIDLIELFTKLTPEGLSFPYLEGVKHTNNNSYV